MSAGPGGREGPKQTACCIGASSWHGSACSGPSRRRRRPATVRGEAGDSLSPSLPWPPTRLLIGAVAQQIEGLHVCHKPLPLPQAQVHQSRLFHGGLVGAEGRQIRRHSRPGNQGAQGKKPSQRAKQSKGGLGCRQAGVQTYTRSLWHLQPPGTARNSKRTHHHRLPVLGSDPHHQPKIEVAQAAVCLQGQGRKGVGELVWV